MRMSSLYSMEAMPVDLTSFCSAGRVHTPYRHRVCVRLGVMGLYRNICGEVGRGVVCNSRGDLTLTRAGRVEVLNQRKTCQLLLASG